MGEYAKYNGTQIKIGTCESMYYLRADQRHLIEGYDFSDFLGEVRFRFPFPDEDTIEPGQFEDYDRGYRIPGAWTLPADYDHQGSVQFKANPGYLLLIRCPEGVDQGQTRMHVDVDGLRVHRNGFSGGYVVRQTKYVDGAWWTVVACSSCGCAWRLPRDVAATVAEAFIDESERQEWNRNDRQYAHSADTRAELCEMAARILAGYTALAQVTP